MIEKWSSYVLLWCPVGGGEREICIVIIHSSKGPKRTKIKGRARFLDLGYPLSPTLGHWSSWFSGLQTWIELDHQLFWFSSLERTDCGTSSPLETRYLHAKWLPYHQTPLSIGFFRQEHWSGLPRPSPVNLPDPRIKSASLMFPALADGVFTTSATWKPDEPPSVLNPFLYTSIQISSWFSRETCVHSLHKWIWALHFSSLYPLTLKLCQ